jgi:tryptophan-rich hypothetical protein
MNPLSPKKLLHSKWTAVQPQNREKHFLVTEVRCDDAGLPRTCLLEAVHSQREMEINWRELQDAGRWKTGWQ